MIDLLYEPHEGVHGNAAHGVELMNQIGNVNSSGKQLPSGLMPSFL